jgi:glyoxylase-like metal-dependent hydrolase (beta-lactamase superfamily II)
MEKIYEDLYQTHLIKAFDSLNTHAYFLKLPTYNVLFYHTCDKKDIQEIKTMGGINFQYLSHRHEATDSLANLKKQFDHKLCADSCEQAFIETHDNVDIVFNHDEKHHDIEVIRTPGHTTGGTSYLYNSPITNKKYLFTGDTLFFWNGELSSLVITHDGGLRKILCQSLKKLLSFTPDVVICSASMGDINVKEFTPEQWKKALDWNMAKLCKT